jgi:NADPH:quinone reductase-like Zn-dependent oxidoreductase
MTYAHPASSRSEILEVVLPGVVEPGGLILERRSWPVPASGQVLVQMEATGVSFAEKAMRRGRYPGQPPFPFVPGYDVVGIVCAVGPDVEDALMGIRVAAITKTGAWASHVLVDAEDLVQVPATLDPCLAETVLVNGVTAWQMLHRKAKVKPGQTILVHGANSGVGVVLCQVAVDAGVRVIGTALPQHHAALRAMGVQPINRAITNLGLAVHALAPEGVDAVFDQLGPESARQSLDLLAPNGSLVCYGNVKALSTNVSTLRLFLDFFPRIVWWNLLPNSLSVSFYNFWEGSVMNKKAFRHRQHADLSTLFDMLVQQKIHPPIAMTFTLSDIAAALTYMESGSILGKVIVVPPVHIGDAVTSQSS